jgi:hypothetical protein
MRGVDRVLFNLCAIMGLTDMCSIGLYLCVDFFSLRGETPRFFWSVFFPAYTL